VDHALAVRARSISLRPDLLALLVGAGADRKRVIHLVQP